MKKSRFSEQRSIGILKEHAARMTAAEFCRKHGISDATFYKLRSKYGGITVSDAKRLKRLLAEQMLDNRRSKRCLQKTSNAQVEERRRDLGDQRETIQPTPRVRPRGCGAKDLSLSASHAKLIINTWRSDYNHNRPHTSLRGLTPIEYANTDQLWNRANL